MSAPRVYEQGTSTYVIGTSDIGTALGALGISPETHRWGSTEFGFFVRRDRRWVAASNMPKDARPGVCFIGPIREAGDPGE